MARATFHNLCRIKKARQFWSFQNTTHVRGSDSRPLQIMSRRAVKFAKGHFEIFWTVSNLRAAYKCHLYHPRWHRVVIFQSLGGLGGDARWSLAKGACLVKSSAWSTASDARDPGRACISFNTCYTFVEAVTLMTIISWPRCKIYATSFSNTGMCRFNNVVFLRFANISTDFRISWLSEWGREGVCELVGEWVVGLVSDWLDEWVVDE